MRMKRGSALSKVLRYLVSVGLALVTLEALGLAFRAIVDPFSGPGYLLQYLRFRAEPGRAVVGLRRAARLFTAAGPGVGRAPQRSGAIGFACGQPSSQASERISSSREAARSNSKAPSPSG